MEKLSRKEFLKKAGIFGLTAVAGTTLLAACGGGDTGAGDSGSGAQAPPPPPPPQPMPNAAADPCESYNADLDDNDLSTRNSLKYVAVSEKDGENCLNCQFYQPDKFEGSCGGCQLFANGAVAEAGYCISWTAKQTS